MKLIPGIQNAGLRKPRQRRNLHTTKMTGRVFVDLDGAPKAALESHLRGHKCA